MQYSLLSRFRGALLGCLIGETFGDRVGGRWQSMPSGLLKDASPPTVASGWTQVAAIGIDSLVRCGGLNLEDWGGAAKTTVKSLLATHSPKVVSLSEAAIATLPVALFFHEDTVKQRDMLNQSASFWQGESEASVAILTLGEAIASALKEQLHPHTLIPRLLANGAMPDSLVAQELEEVQFLINKGAGLDRAIAQFRRQPATPTKAIALAFYCFLSTPEDFRLSVTRAVRISHQQQTIVALTGALSGAYNSLAGIPIGWRLASTYSSSDMGMLKLAERLFAVWSGVYDDRAAERCFVAAVAAPYVIQRRSRPL
ncbi:MAG: ADP-ribosylglycohydrolase family protein [Kastovskya adunca ATA6-11-RM4]|nr:ADP-ribosylglycohydrolase family protein [Kastovskya adunca ATA6-11-RM4]